MRRFTLIAMLAAVVVALSATGATAVNGHTAGQLEAAGWTCIPVGEIHCTRTFAALGTDDYVVFKVFSALTGEFLGTELLVRDTAYKGQPCPTDPPGQYTYLPTAGILLPFYACHRYDSGF